MGMAHILYVFEDGLTAYDPQATKLAVGAAVMSVCLDSTHDFKSGHPRGRRTEAVLGASNCVNRAAEVHSTDEQIFVWSGNCLRTLDQLRDEDVEEARKLFDRFYEDRKRRRV